MACHEISALRLGFMNLIGIDDEAEKKHEQEELGSALLEESPIKNLANAENLENLLSNYQSSLITLEEKFAKLEENHPKKAYYQSLLILTKKVELELERNVGSMKSLYDELEQMHDYVHEIFPAN